jgi:hypothetical protein
MSFATYNGWTILPMPTSPVPMQIDMDIIDSVAMNQSPFSLATQMQVWPGAESMVWNVSLPPMKTKTALAWTAWMKSLQGILNVFPMGDPNHLTPQGNVAGTPLVDGTSGGYNLPASYFLHTKGWTPNTANVLLPGDYIQIGYRMHSVTQAASSDNNGCAVLSIWPSIREQPTDGQTVVTSNTQGLWRLADNKRSYSEHANKMVAISFKAVEAR